MPNHKLNIIGGGLAGSEAAWQAANRGMEVKLYEMRNKENLTYAHKTDKLAELVCSNSFRNDELNSAIGLLHEELRRMNSLILKLGDKHRVPAGSALAIDREAFSNDVQENIANHPNIEIIREEITALDIEGQQTIVATGPLTSNKLTETIIEVTGKQQLAFYDAIAPIIYKDSIDFSICWMQSRYDKAGKNGTGKDYINCPLSEEEYYEFINELLSADKTTFKDWEKNTPYFDGCLPIEVMAERGKDTLRFGPMKPVGLTNPHTNQRPFAVVQLRQDNKLGSLYNIVGFQTKLKYGEQKKVFKKIPGLSNAEFARLGGLHRNTFIKSPEILDNYLRLKDNKQIFFAGQITGVEGYVESAASGMLCGIFASEFAKNNNKLPQLPPSTTALGSLLSHVTLNAHSETFQPMNINFGLFPSLEPLITNNNAKKTLKLKKQDRINAYIERALNDLYEWNKEPEVV